MKEREVVASANVGVGLWTLICMGFCLIFGKESNRLKMKQDRVLSAANSRLNLKIKKIPNVEKMIDYRVTWSRPLAVTVSAIVVVSESKEEH